ncbi:L-arabinonate dehydratase [Acidocella aminolytica]|jgi:dihydroxy-acid dehydratase|uniref:Dihydroxy-acid dehydratase n=1 Tax=Acidocella aminolytica 101 = DSM 11237 TaxID=1120923 RepID=A0A0D6PKE7_9PROT|nr:L-arabinonate dehydratase [Acidocella aminolytica]GAN81209.1 dihydroxy-acid dehydratase [Acidocella aminolytica 101 = DSM 11237]GBQ31880.1 dihydroxy-acid dehydratase [Acidocella aminolytica 101 = DSM 11237]SHE85310.1 dihydroxy-acid dehydratase [Acidocella aminolytica 101 = DSM 11237]
MTQKTYSNLRSYRWYGVENLRAFGHRSRTKQMGFSRKDFEGKPVIGILNTWSDMNSCHSHFPQRVEEVKRGIWQAGGFPVVLPAMSVGEPFVKPTTMLYRNFLAMEAEELIRSHPIDGVVLMGGCDKTTPALLMGAISMNLPAIYFPAGAMLRGNWRGKVLGSGSDVWKYWAEKRAGNLSDEVWAELEDGIARSAGTCMTMGTATTMMTLAESLGFVLPGGSSIPAPDSNHSRLASDTGRRIVDMVWDNLKPSDILSPESFENAIVTALALSGSTNAIVHIIAMARRANIDLKLEAFDRLSRNIPVLADIRPTGRFLMEDFYYAGGIKGLLSRLRAHLHLDCLTVNGATLGANIEGAEVYHDEVIRTWDNPVWASGGLAVLTGNLAPRGAVIKPGAAEPHLLRHRGHAIVFKNYNDMERRIDDPNLPVTPDSVLVLQDAGPIGAPGMPEWGQLPIPKKILAQGIRDMVRISDARMSGTSYGACILHVCPESRVGGPLAFVQDGDIIEINVDERKLELLVNDEELDQRRAAWTPPPPHYERGYGAIFSQHVRQADEGCDFDFLETSAGESVSEPEIH